MPRGPDRDRRAFLGETAAWLTAGGAMLSAGPALAALVPTPRQSEGPFYPERIPVDHDADLLRVGDRPMYTGGRPLYLTGSVVTPDGRPVDGVRVEIWQCDARGHYHHSGDRGSADADFQGYGRSETRDGGRWAFRTIRPAPYPGRTPHIHFKLSGRGIDGLTTQMYVAGEPRNARDFLLNSIRDPKARRSVLVPLQPAAARESGALAGDFRIVLGGNTVR